MLDLLKQSYAVDYQINTDVRNWDGVEQIHHRMWETELEDHKRRTQELIQYKVGSLTSSHNARMAFIYEQMKKNSNAKIRVMHEGWIRNATADYESHKLELEKAAEKADILSETLAYGILIVKPDNSPESNEVARE